MRHHWGLGVGHLYAHQSASSCIPRESTDINPSDELHVDSESGGKDTYTAGMNGDELDNLEKIVNGKDGRMLKVRLQKMVPMTARLQKMVPMTAITTQKMTMGYILNHLPWASLQQRTVYMVVCYIWASENILSPWVELVWSYTRSNGWQRQGSRIRYPTSSKSHRQDSPYKKGQSHR